MSLNGNGETVWKNEEGGGLTPEQAEEIAKIPQIESELGEFKPYVVQHFEIKGEGEVELTDEAERLAIINNKYRALNIGGALLELQFSDTESASYHIVGADRYGVNYINLSVYNEHSVCDALAINIGDMQNLQTKEKSLVGAIGEVNDKVTQIGSQVGELTSRPSTEKQMGYLTLDSSKTFASQVTKSNTIYEIKSDFELPSDNFKLPSNIVLKFNGGKLRNGTLLGNATIIDAPPV